MPRRTNPPASEQLKVRQTISFSEEQYEALQDLARKHHVSIGWVVRYACERLIRERAGRPLLLEGSESEEQEEVGGGSDR